MFFNYRTKTQKVDSVVVFLWGAIYLNHDVLEGHEEKRKAKGRFYPQIRCR